jgi:hypothetical protein
MFGHSIVSQHFMEPEGSHKAYLCYIKQQTKLNKLKLRLKLQNIFRRNLSFKFNFSLYPPRMINAMHDADSNPVDYLKKRFISAPNTI